jgi:hypothetical protein
MRAQGSGNIINIGSLACRTTSPIYNPYATSKFGLNAMTDGLRPGSGTPQHPGLHDCSRTYENRGCGRDHRSGSPRSYSHVHKSRWSVGAARCGRDHRVHCLLATESEHFRSVDPRDHRRGLLTRSSRHSNFAAGDQFTGAAILSSNWSRLAPKS